MSIIVPPPAASVSMVALLQEGRRKDTSKGHPKVFSCPAMYTAVNETNADTAAIH